MQQALVNVLGDQVAQKGSNINNERMRFDFTFDRPMTKEEIEQVEQIVNEQIKADLPVTMEVMSLEAAQKANINTDVSKTQTKVSTSEAINNIFREVIS